MIIPQPDGQQTGQFSRIANPVIQTAPSFVQARVHAGQHMDTPVRNMLAGASLPSTGILARLRAWLRGER